MFVPRVTHLLTKTWAGSLAIPFAVAGPLLVVVVLPVVAVFGWTTMWHTALVLGGVLAALGLVLSVALPWSLRSDARWIELTPGENPARVLVKRLSGATRTSACAAAAPRSRPGNPPLRHVRAVLAVPSRARRTHSGCRSPALDTTARLRSGTRHLDGRPFPQPTRYA